VLPGDTEDTLAARVLAEEHIIYPQAVRLFVEDRLRASQTAKSASPRPPVFKFKETHEIATRDPRQC
jgi:hypothetical protein